MYKTLFLEIDNNIFYFNELFKKLLYNIFPYRRRVFHHCKLLFLLLQHIVYPGQYQYEHCSAIVLIHRSYKDLDELHWQKQQDIVFALPAQSYQHIDWASLFA